MSSRQNRMLKSSAGPAAATLASRLLGLARTMLEAAVLGGGVYASGWSIAFMIPNLFRRLLGEGALGTALIPIITHTEQDEGPEKVRRDLAVVFAALSAVLAAVVIAVSLLALLLRPFIASAQWRLALHLLPYLMPYALFICLVGIAGSILNSRKVFFLPALGALLLNVFLIGGLLAGKFLLKPQHSETFTAFLEKQALLVLLSGFLQLLLMLLLLRRYSAFPIFAGLRGQSVKVLKELWRLVLPGMIGAAALQVSFVVDILLASTRGEMAVPSLNNTARIIDLPIGIFAISFGTVLMSSMSRSAARRDHDRIARDLVFGLRHVCFACVPMAVFLMVFREPVMRLTFLRGNFTPEQLQETMYVALFYGAGIPAFCALKVILPAFHARKEMRKPLIISLIAILTNIVLNLILMWPLRQGGIALATVLSSVLSNTLLLLALRRDGFRFELGPVARTFTRSLLAAALGALIFFGYPQLRRRFELPVVDDLAALGVSLALFSLAYLAASRLLGGREFGELLTIFRNRTNLPNDVT